MSKTIEVSVLVTCEDEDEYDDAVDNIMDLVSTWSGTVSGTAWHTWPDDDDHDDHDDRPQGAGSPAAASNGSIAGSTPALGSTGTCRVCALPHPIRDHQQ